MLSVLVFLEMLAYAILSGKYASPTGREANAERRSDMARILTAFNDYQSNNNSKVPSTQSEIDKFVTRYIGGSNSDTTSCSSDQFCDPDGMPYHLSNPIVLSSDMDNVLAGKTFATDNHTIHYYQSASCGAVDGSLKYEESDKDIAFIYILGNDSLYCTDNQ